MIPCDVIRDLLVLYVSEECSEDTRELVEEHLKSCESCRRALEELRGPVLPREEPEARAELDEKAKDFQVKKGLRKIRRRWLASLLCVLLLFPLVGLGFMVRNQIEGEGVCFTNLDELYASYAFLKAVEKGNYEKAFSYVDAEGLYEYMTEGQLEGYTDWDALYTSAEIGGVSYYVTHEVYGNEYQKYLEDGDEARFWMRMMIYNSEHSSSTPIPEEFFDEAAALFEEETGTVISTDQTVGNVLYDDPDYIVYGHCYTAVTSGEGEAYYFLPYATELEYPLIFSYSYCLPQEVFEQLRTDTDVITEQLSACADYYREMGLEMYTQLLKEEFLDNMQELDERGITVQASSLAWPPHFLEGRQFSVVEIADTAVYKSIYTEGHWHLYIQLSGNQDGRTSNIGTIGIDADGLAIWTERGIEASDVSYKVFNTTQLLTLNKDPAGYYLTHPGDLSP